MFNTNANDSKFNRTDDNSGTFLEEDTAKVVTYVGLVLFGILSLIAVVTILSIIPNLIFPLVAIYFFSVFFYAAKVKAHVGKLTNNEAVALLVWPREAWKSRSN